MAKKKYYAVAAGRRCGIFVDWPTTQEQVKGYGGAKYKSFGTREEAEAWLENPVYATHKQPGKSPGKVPPVGGQQSDGVIVYTDGGAINNPGPGGYGIVIDHDGDRRELSGGFRLTTNNRMEMTAAIVALRELRGTNKKVLLHSDSSYLVNGIEKGWARKWRSRGWRKSDNKPVLNIDLWKTLLDLLEETAVRFIWVKGHAGHELNERCDRLAVSSARQKGLPPDLVYEQSLSREEQGGG